MIDESLIRELADPACYPERVETVILRQTHLSVVCVAGDFAYKLKKPINLPFVDFSTVELRLRSCEDEVTLNRRLCPDLYLGVVSLVATPEGPRFVVDRDPAGALPAGDLLEPAVHMRRLPADRMMDLLLDEHAVSHDEVREISGIMAAFHRKVALEHDSPEASATACRLRDFALANFEETREQATDGFFDPALHRLLHERTRRDFERLLPLLERRAREGRVVDGHGDLHARNICLCKPPVIYDCIEFSRDLRLQDVAAENAFLAMDLRFRGHRELANAYLDRYIEITGDTLQRELLPTLVRYRAMVRAKVAAIAATEKEIAPAERETHAHSARRHLELAAASAIEEADTWLICATGLPATGKSHALEILSQATGWPRLASDLVRKELAGTPPAEPLSESYYRPEFSQRVYETLLARAEATLARGPVLLDANFPTRAHREMAVDCAGRAGARVAFVWFRADEETIQQRLRRRASDSGAVSDADLAVYRKLKSGFEPPEWNRDAPGPHSDVLLVTSWSDRDPVFELAHLLGRLLQASTI